MLQLSCSHKCGKTCHPVGLECLERLNVVIHWLNSITNSIKPRSNLKLIFRCSRKHCAQGAFYTLDTDSPWSAYTSWAVLCRVLGCVFCDLSIYVSLDNSPHPFHHPIYRAGPHPTLLSTRARLYSSPRTAINLFRGFLRTFKSFLVPSPFFFTLLSTIDSHYLLIHNITAHEEPWCASRKNHSPRPERIGTLIDRDVGQVAVHMYLSTAMLRNRRSLECRRNSGVLFSRVEVWSTDGDFLYSQRLVTYYLMLR